MTRYFVAGNMWLVITLVLLIGKKGSNPVFFFGVGGWHSPGFYNLLTLACFALGVGFLMAARNKED